MLIEVCVESVAGVRAAAHVGAARVELCAALVEGGITPSIGTVRQAVAAAAGRLGVHVIVRPRGGDFLYDADEFSAMAADIVACKDAGANGVVLGVLQSNGAIDVERTATLTALARPLAVTFHRAFDMARDAMASLDDLLALGVDRLLTSGQEPSVLQGASLIRRLIERAAGRIVVMPGGDITPRNAARIIEETGATELHFAALETVPSAMAWRNEAVHMGGTLRPPEFERSQTTVAAIAAVIATLG